MYYCCVPLCKSTSKIVPMHRFPVDEKLFHVWLNSVGNKNLLTKTKVELRNSYRICDLHFEDVSRIINGKGRRGCTLKADAVPSRYLPCQEDKENIEPEDPCPSTSVEGQSEEQSHMINNEPTVPELPDELDQPTPKRQAKAKRATFSPTFKILKGVGANRIVQLSPDAQSIYKVAVHLREKTRRLQSNLFSARTRLKQAQKFLESPEFLRAKVNKVTFNFLVSQMKLQKVPPKGRRFTMEDKIFALSLLKQSPRGYTLLRKIFALPSRRTLSNMLKEIPLKPGINESIFAMLKTTTQSMKELDKYCVIIFDEMALEPGLYYNTSTDTIEGFQDNGCGQRKSVLSDKAMVFMARGIGKKWKQALAYYFNDGGMKTDVLVKTLKEIIRNVRASGLKVIAVVCDQGAANRSAINALYKETEEEYARKGKENKNFGFEVDGEEVVPIYDVPHLLKCVRNILYQYIITYKWNDDEEKKAQWKHIQKLYELDDPTWDYKLCHKLTNAHVDNTKKMKVSIAAQVLSARVAATMKMLARLAPQHMDPTAHDTAEFLLFMDKTFDSLNGSHIKPRGGKLLRTAVTPTSSHRNFWIEGIKVFSSMTCNNAKRKNVKPPTISNFVHTLKAFNYLTAKLFSLGFNFICPRNFNQDPLENFFGSIRSHGVRNVNPDCHSFANSFKSLVINNYVSPHSYGSNCEPDNSEALSSFKEFFKTAKVSSDEPIEVDILDIQPEPKNYESQLLTYLAGYVAKKLLKSVKGCKLCRSQLIGSRSDLTERETAFINSRAYSSNALLYPNTNFNRLFYRTIELLSTVMPLICIKTGVKFNFKCNFLLCNEFDIFTCKNHNVVNLFFEFICTFHINTWCKNVNRILKGKDLPRKYQDPIKILARQKYQTHKAATSKVKIIKNLQ